MNAKPFLWGTGHCNQMRINFFSVDVNKLLLLCALYSCIYCIVQSALKPSKIAQCSLAKCSEEKQIYFKECFANEKSKYFCLNQKQILILLYFCSITQKKKLQICLGSTDVIYNQQPHYVYYRIMVDIVKVSPKSLISWRGMHSVNSSSLDVCSQHYFTLFHKNLELALEVLLQKEVIIFKIRLPLS